jgi:SHS2 domain-containing protein
MDEHRFELVEHTADKAFVAYGETLEKAFEAAAYAVFSMMADLALHQPTAERAVVVSGGDDVTLLKKWLDELLFISEVEWVLPVRFRVEKIGAGKVTSVIETRPTAPDIEWLGPGVKAVTYHGMEIRQLDGQYCVQVVVDV